MQRLNYLHKRAAEFLVMGLSEVAVARLMKVRPEDIYRWRGEIVFKKYMHSLSQDISDVLAGFAEQLRREAFEVMHKALQSKNFEERRWAVEQVFSVANVGKDLPREALLSINIGDSPEAREAKEHAKQFLQLTRGSNKRAEREPTSMAEA